MYNDAGVYSWFVCLYVLTIWIRKFAHNQTENNQTNIEQYYREDDEDDDKICRFIKINLSIIYFHSKNSKRIGIKREGWKREKLENLLTRKEQTDNQTVQRLICNHHTTIFIIKLALGQRCIV